MIRHYIKHLYLGLKQLNSELNEDLKHKSLFARTLLKALLKTAFIYGYTLAVIDNRRGR